MKIHGMKKKSIILLAFNLFTLSSFSQTIKDNIDKQHNSANKANAAKADVLIQKKTIPDSTQTQNTIAVKSVNNKYTTAHKKRKKKLCNHKNL
jgi:uncharacterized membrane protein YheB (UPF0754 family)